MRRNTRRHFLRSGGWALAGGLFLPRGFGQVLPGVIDNPASTQAAAGGGGGNNIAFRNESHATPGTANGATLTEPTGAALNDVFFSLAFCDQASSSLGIPTGWTSLYSGNATNSSSAFRYNLAWIRRGGSAPSLVWTMSTSTWREVYILAFSGVRTAGNPYETSADGGVTTLNGTLNPDAPSVTTSTNNDWIIAIGVTWSGATSAFGAPSGYTIRTLNSGGPDGVMATKLLTSAGAENPAAFTGTAASATSVDWQATVALVSS